VNQWLSDAEGLYFCTNNFVLKTHEGYSDIGEDGEKKPINVRVKTKDYTMGSPFSLKQVKLMGFVFRQFYGYEDSTTDVIVWAGYRQFRISDIDTNESLIWGRTWNKRWGYRDSQVKVAEVKQIADTFSAELLHSKIDIPVALLAINFRYKVPKGVLPMDENLLKDRVLGTDFVPWRR
jgi:hypothetical protein